MPFPFLSSKTKSPILDKHELTVTATEAVDVQPFALVTVNVYVPPLVSLAFEIDGF